MNENKTLKKFFEKLFVNARHLKIDGLTNIVSTRYILASFILLIVLLSSATISIYLIIGSFNQYYEHRVTSTIRYVPEESSVLPTITFCNINPFATDVALYWLEEANVTMPVGDEEADFWKMYLELEDYVNRTRGFPLTIDEKLQLSDSYYNIPLFILEYSMHTFAYNKYDFYTFFHPKYFVCHTFNALGVNVLTRSKDGLFGYLFNGGEDDWTSEMFPNNLKGFYMFISNSSDYMFGTDRSPILLTPKLRTRLSISRHFYRQAEWPYSTCSVLEDNSLAVDLEDRSIFDEVLATNASYTQNTCLSFCTQVMITRRCGCKSNRIGYNVTGYNYCGITDELGCAASVMNLLSDINKECLPKCPLECSKMKFDMSYVSNSWEATSFITFWFYQYVTDTILAANTLSIEIMYNDLAYVETIEEPKMNGKDLLATIGGHMHLFLGMSLFSFVELLELFYLVGFDTMVGKVNREKIINFKDVEKLKMDGIPNAVRSSHYALLFLWLVLFVGSAGACVYLIVDTINMYNENQVVTTLNHIRDLSNMIHFCNEYPMTSDYALDLLRNLSLFDKTITESFLAVQAYMNETRGYYLTNEELSCLSDIDRLVVTCKINGFPCEFKFYYDVPYFGCYQVDINSDIGKYLVCPIIVTKVPRG